MNNYILCYKTPQGNRPCKTPLGNYIIGSNIEDINIKSTEYWEYYKMIYGENNLIIL